MTEETWTLEHTHYIDDGKRAGYSTIKCGDDDVATFYLTGHDMRAGKGQRARAILAAAAPAMLDALKLYDATYCATQTHPTVSQEAACMSVVRAAIALATTDQEEAVSRCSPSSLR